MSGEASAAGEAEYLSARNASVPPGRAADGPAAGAPSDDDGDDEFGAPAEPKPEPLDEAVSAADAAALKAEGNAAFSAKDGALALEKYNAALRSAHLRDGERAVLWANCAAVHVRAEDWAAVKRDAGKALAKEPGMRKALLRRKLACEKEEDWRQASEDAKALGCKEGEVMALEIKAKEKAERETAEAMKQLKGLGNSLLGAFGMSLDNFQMDKDLDTGGYSVKMKQ